MANLKGYSIAFKGLGEGKHDFEYQVGRKFFEYFDGGIVEDGDVNVVVTLEKRSALMTLEFQVKGSVKIQCDRCLELYDQRVESLTKVFIKYGEENFEEGDDVIWLKPDETHINVLNLIYDFIALSIPIKQVHPDDEEGNSGCNPEMIRKLNTMSGGDVNDEEEQTTDPRWNDLKKLLDNK